MASDTLDASLMAPISILATRHIAGSWAHYAETALSLIFSDRDVNTSIRTSSFTRVNGEPVKFCTPPSTTS